MKQKEDGGGGRVCIWVRSAFPGRWISEKNVGHCVPGPGFPLNDLSVNHCEEIFWFQDHCSLGSDSHFSHQWQNIS